jgi:hypothetical protein
MSEGSLRVKFVLNFSLSAKILYSEAEIAIGLRGTYEVFRSTGFSK